MWDEDDERPRWRRWCGALFEWRWLLAVSLASGALLGLLLSLVVRQIGGW